MHRDTVRSAKRADPCIRHRFAGNMFTYRHRIRHRLVVKINVDPLIERIAATVEQIES